MDFLHGDDVDEGGIFGGDEEKGLSGRIGGDGGEWGWSE
jgi:hypothetical protein